MLKGPNGNLWECFISVGASALHMQSVSLHILFTLCNNSCHICCLCFSIRQTEFGLADIQRCIMHNFCVCLFIDFFSHVLVKEWGTWAAKTLFVHYSQHITFYIHLLPSLSASVPQSHQAPRQPWCRCCHSRCRCEWWCAAPWTSPGPLWSGWWCGTSWLLLPHSAPEGHLGEGGIISSVFSTIISCIQNDNFHLHCIIITMSLLLLITINPTLIFRWIFHNCMYEKLIVVKMNKSAFTTSHFPWTWKFMPTILHLYANGLFMCALKYE